MRSTETLGDRQLHKYKFSFFLFFVISIRILRHGDPHKNAKLNAIFTDNQYHPIPLYTAFSNQAVADINIAGFGVASMA